MFAEVLGNEDAFDHESDILLRVLDAVPKVVGDGARNEDDGLERDRTGVTLEVVPGKWVLIVLEGCLVELSILLVRDVFGLTGARSENNSGCKPKRHLPSPKRSLTVQVNPFIDHHLFSRNRLLFFFLLVGDVFYYSLFFIRLLCGLFLILWFSFRLAFLLWDWNLLFMLSKKIDREGGRECGML